MVPLDGSDPDVDLVLKDTFRINEDLTDYIARSPAPVVAFAASDEPAAVHAAVAKGAAGYIHKGVTLGRLVDALQRIHAGQPVVELGDTVSDRDEPGGGDCRVAGSGARADRTGDRRCSVSSAKG